VYLKTQIAGEERAHVMTVKARKKIEKTYKKKKYVFYEYQLADSANQLYREGEWIPEKELESADGS
jgi:isocitrate dehydrogenase